MEKIVLAAIPGQVLQGGLHVPRIQEAAGQGGETGIIERTAGGIKEVDEFVPFHADPEGNKVAVPAGEDVPRRPHPPQRRISSAGDHPAVRVPEAVEIGRLRDGLHESGLAGAVPAGRQADPFALFDP